MSNHVELRELVIAHYGKALKEADRDERGEHVVYGSSGEVGRHSQSLATFPTIIIGRKGSVGAVTHAPQGGWPIDTAYYLEPRDSDRIELRYLYWALRNAQLDRRAITTSIPGLNRDELYRTRLLLPPLAEQRRITATLEKAEMIRRRRRESIQLLGEFLHSSYSAIVGLGNPNYNEWREFSIANLAARRDGAMRTGPFGSALRHAEFTNQGDVAVLGIDNVVENCFRWAEPRFITHERYEKNFKRYTVRAGDVLVSIMGTTGKSAVVPDDVPLAISTKHLATITLDRERAHPEYVSHAIHMDPSVLAQIGSANRGAIMSGLNLGLIRRLRVRIPPMSQQLAFVRLVEETRSLAARIAESLRMHERLLQSLMQRAFNGDSS